MRQQVGKLFYTQQVDMREGYRVKHLEMCVFRNDIVGIGSNGAIHKFVIVCV